MKVKSDNALKLEQESNLFNHLERIEEAQNSGTSNSHQTSSEKSVDLSDNSETMNEFADDKKSRNQNLIYKSESVSK